MQIDFNDPDVIADRIPAPPTPVSLPRSREVTLLAISRKKRAAAVDCLTHPETWKVCEGCERLLSVARLLCPFCHGYRFSTEETRVIATCCRDTGREPNLPLPRI